MQQKQCISIVIRVRNAAKDLEKCLGAVTQQALPADNKMEIIVVDNESQDDSANVARRFGADVVFLAAQDFSWGRALNRGISKASGNIILILSADAYPADKNWIIEMIKPFEDDRVAVVYGRQIPRSDAPIDEIVRLRKSFGETTQIMKYISEEFSRKGGLFTVSNACAAIRKTAWEILPYDETIAAGEEGVWTYNIVQKGFYAFYRAEACVYHSHNDTFFRNAWRNLELIKKNIELDGKHMNCFVYIRFVLSKIKKRACNCFYPELRLTARLKGAIILPFEVMSFCIAALFFHNQKKLAKFRSFFWYR